MKNVMLENKTQERQKMRCIEEWTKKYSVIRQKKFKNYKKKRRWAKKEFKIQLIKNIFGISENKRHCKSKVKQRLTEYNPKKQTI